jgi:hypothetical protein
VHDYFDIIGVPTNAAASEVRRASARRVRRAHPDFSGVVEPAPPPAPWRCHEADDIAVDFLDIGCFVDRMQAAFFADDTP